MPRKLIGAVAVAALIASCGPLPRSRTRGGGTSGGEAAFTSQCRGDFGAGATASRFEALMLATYELHEAAAETEQALATACRDMGQALEMPAACEAHVDASLECTPGRAELVVSGGPDEETQARMARVREAVRIGIASVHTVRERAQRLARSGRDVLAQLEGLPDAIREIGVSAAACSLGALADLRASMTSITVSVEVSVSVSASVEGGPPG